MQSWLRWGRGYHYVVLRSLPSSIYYGVRGCDLAPVLCHVLAKCCGGVRGIYVEDRPN